MKIVAHLTNNHQLKAADELIAKLKIQYIPKQNRDRIKFPVSVLVM